MTVAGSQTSIAVPSRGHGLQWPTYQMNKGPTCLDRLVLQGSQAGEVAALIDVICRSQSRQKPANDTWSAACRVKM